MKAKKEHNNKTVYMHTYTYMNSKANSERTLQSICNVVFEIIYIFISPSNGSNTHTFKKK